jgi:hypothetical protein
VYNAHLEVFCGLLARIAQLADIFADARRMADAGYPRQAILGGWGMGKLAGGQAGGQAAGTATQRGTFAAAELYGCLTA